MKIDFENLIEGGQPVTFDFNGQIIHAKADCNSGYVFFSPPSAEFLAHYYQNEYQNEHSSYYTVEADYEPSKNAYHADRILQAYVNFTGKRPRSSFELGCSYGGLVAEMARRGVDSRGSDINERAIAAGRQEMGNLQTIAATNQEALSVIDEPVDLIYSLHVLEHDPNMIQVLKQMAKILSEDGLIYISVPNAMFVRSVLKGFRSNPWANYPQHLHMLSPGFVPALCEEIGFVPLYHDTRVFFGADPELHEIFNGNQMSDVLVSRLEFILGQGGFGMELNVLMAPLGSKLAIRHAVDASIQKTRLEMQRQNEMAIRRFLRD
jgi:SAM-dependent methyltransferase